MLRASVGSHRRCARHRDRRRLAQRAAPGQLRDGWHGDDVGEDEALIEAMEALDADSARQQRGDR